MNPTAAGAEFFAWRESGEDNIGILRIDSDCAKQAGIGRLFSRIVGCSERCAGRLPGRCSIRRAKHPGATRPQHTGVQPIHHKRSNEWKDATGSALSLASLSARAEPTVGVYEIRATIC